MHTPKTTPHRSLPLLGLECIALLAACGPSAAPPAGSPGAGMLASALDVLEAERSVLADQQALVLVQSALLQNQIALYKALGGGLEPTP